MSYYDEGDWSHSGGDWSHRERAFTDGCL